MSLLVLFSADGTGLDNLVLMVVFVLAGLAENEVIASLNHDLLSPA